MSVLFACTFCAPKNVFKDFSSCRWFDAGEDDSAIERVLVPAAPVVLPLPSPPASPEPEPEVKPDSPEPETEQPPPEEEPPKPPSSK